MEITWEKIKEHVERHKVAYSCTATAVVFTGFTWTIMKGRYAGIRGVPDGPTEVTVRPFAFLSSQNNNTNVVTVIEREGRGHPGYLVRNVDTNEIYSSQKEAARQMNVHPSLISAHINGKFADVDGNHLERIAIPA